MFVYGFQDINRDKSDNFTLKIKTVELWIERINEAISNGYVVTVSLKILQLIIVWLGSFIFN